MRHLQSEVAFWRGRAAAASVASLAPLRFSPAVAYDGRAVQGMGLGYATFYLL